MYNKLNSLMFGMFAKPTVFKILKIHRIFGALETLSGSREASIRTALKNFVFGASQSKIVKVSEGFVTEKMLNFSTYKN
jgi:hypothetical protein